MSKKLSTICIIPARGGSKRIKKKNIKNFFGKPMISYAINNAKKSKCFDKIIVSTDNELIAKISKKYGAEVPFVRPKKLSNNFTALAPVISHAISELKEKNIIPDLVCVLLATTPLLNYRHLVNSKKKFLKSNSKFLISVNKFGYPIQRALKINTKKKLSMFDKKFFDKRSQDLEEAFHDAGQFYWGNTSSFKEQSKILIENTNYYIIDELETVDIDTHEDWNKAKKIFKIFHKVN